MSVWIIGLGSQRPPVEFQEVLKDCVIVARDGAQAEAWLNDTEWRFHDLSATNDATSPLKFLEGAIDTVRNIVDSGDRVCLLTPGAAHVGDILAKRLSCEFDTQVVPGVVQTPLALGDCQVLDALSLAIAEETVPFDRGLADVDTTRATVVTNYCGRAVRALARRRLDRIYGRSPDHQLANTLYFKAEARYEATPSVAGLEQIVAMLRSPEGCPWDREQTVESLLPQLVEELDEFRDAWDSQDYQEQFDELGDVLLHIIMIAQVAYEGGRFDFSDVVRAISGKMVRRHPHVFSDTEVGSMDELYSMWDDIKAQERADRA